MYLDRARSDFLFFHSADLMNLLFLDTLLNHTSMLGFCTTRQKFCAVFRNLHELHGGVGYQTGRKGIDDTIIRDAAMKYAADHLGKLFENAVEEVPRGGAIKVASGH